MYKLGMGMGVGFGVGLGVRVPNLASFTTRNSHFLILGLGVPHGRRRFGAQAKALCLTRQHPLFSQKLGGGTPKQIFNILGVPLTPK